MRVAAFTSTGSKQPQVLFGDPGFVVQRMQRSSGCQIWDDLGNEYLDFVMGLGAVALGYGEPAVNAAVIAAVNNGAIGSLAPVEEELLAAEICEIMPHVEQVRFLKTGAEAVAAAVRLARVVTGRSAVLGCGYHGWLDWCSASAGVPGPVKALYSEISFNDVEQSVETIRSLGDRLACVVIEPVIEAAPTAEWLRALREETARVGALLIYDEIKTAFRVGMQGAAGRWGGDPDLVVLGKALANGYPLAAVGGVRSVMQSVSATWISSTMSTEFVSLAAARATLKVMRDREIPSLLEALGARLLTGLHELAGKYPGQVASANGIPQMCYLKFVDDSISVRVAQQVVGHGLLFKRSAYNFVSAAHRVADVDRALSVLDEVLRTC